MAIQMFARDPDTLTEQLQVHNLSFNNPDKIVNKLVKLRLDEYNASKIMEQVQWEAMTQASSCTLLIKVLVEVSDIPSHRHRIDAINILTEFYSQTNGRPPRTLVPMPQPSGYDGVGVSEVDYDAARQIMREAGPSQTPNNPSTPALFTKRLIETSLKYPLLDTTELLEGFLCSDDERETTSNNILYLLGRTGGPDPPRLNAFGEPFHRGSPRSLEPPETLFGNSPDPYNVLELPQEAWPELEIFDHRLGSGSGGLNQGHYIYQFFSFIRQAVSNPDIASLFAIVYRGHLFGDNTVGVQSVVQELPATDAEVISAQKLMTGMFPQVYIQGGEMDRIATNSDPNNPLPQAIFLDSRIFDAIEWGQREGKDIGHLLYYAFSTIIYELAHYMNAFTIITQPTLVAAGDPDQQGHHESFESWGGPGDPTFGRSTLFHRGHLPQIVQWLIFGYRLGIDLDLYTRNHHESIHANFWGGRGTTSFDRIEINSYAASKLLKAQPQIRMQYRELIYFLETMAILETSEQLDNEDAVPQPKLDEPLTVHDVDDLVLSDTEDAYTGQPAAPAGSELRNTIRRFRSLRGQKNPPPRPKRTPPQNTATLVYSIIQQEGTSALLISILCFGVCMGFTYDPRKATQNPMRVVMENLDELIVPCLAVSLVMVCAVGLGRGLRGIIKRGL